MSKGNREGELIVKMKHRNTPGNHLSPGQETSFQHANLGNVICKSIFRQEHFYMRFIYTSFRLIHRTLRHAKRHIRICVEFLLL